MGNQPRKHEKSKKKSILIRRITPLKIKGVARGRPLLKKKIAEPKGRRKNQGRIQSESERL